MPGSNRARVLPLVALAAIVVGLVGVALLCRAPKPEPVPQYGSRLMLTWVDPATGDSVWLVKFWTGGNEPRLPSE